MDKSSQGNMDAGIELSIIIAAYNEEAVLKINLNKIIQELSRRPEIVWELICVNDGSKDGTGAILNETADKDSRVIVLHHRTNFGQGRALRTAFDIARGICIITLDADLSYGPEYIFRLFDTANQTQADVILASPYVNGGEVVNVPTHRHLVSRLGNYYLSKMSPYRVSTSTCVVRAYNKTALNSLFLTSDGMELQLEILIKAAQLNLKVVEIPAKLEWSLDKASESKVHRSSKMKIFKTMKISLLLGWLSKPATIFMAASALLVIPSLFMLGGLFCRAMQIIYSHLDVGIITATSLGLKELFENYAYSIILYGVMGIIGLQIFLFTLIFIQNKFYFDEMYKLCLSNSGKQPYGESF